MEPFRRVQERQIALRDINNVPDAEPEMPRMAEGLTRRQLGGND